MSRKWNAFFAAVMAGMMISGNAVASEELIASAGEENEIAISEQEHTKGDTHIHVHKDLLRSVLDLLSWQMLQESLLLLLYILFYHLQHHHS